MTLVACCLNCEGNAPYLRVAADSRILLNERTILTDSAIKIFSIPIVCRAPGTDGFFNRIVFDHSIGLAVAGNAILSLNLQASVVPLLSQLGCRQAEQLADMVPTLEEIALFISRICRHFIIQLGGAIGDRAMSTALVFGYCPKSNAFRVFRIEPVVDHQMDPPLATLCTQEDLTDPEHVSLLGRDGDRQEAMRRIEELRHQLPNRDISWWRAPERVVRQLAADENFPAIGGPVQIATAHQRNVQLYARVEPVRPGEPQATMRFLGMDIFDLVGNIGPCAPVIVATI